MTENVRIQVAVGTGPLFKVEEFVGENTVQDLSETIIALPVAAIKVREIVAQLRNLVTHVIHDKVIVQGIIHKQIFYISTDNIERHLAEDIPFSLFLDIPGVVPGDNVHITPIIEAIFFDLISPTELRQKVIFAINAVVTRTLQINLVLGEGRPLQTRASSWGEHQTSLGGPERTNSRASKCDQSHDCLPRRRSHRAATGHLKKHFRIAGDCD